jgi:hypothetical protein
MTTFAIFIHNGETGQAIRSRDFSDPMLALSWLGEFWSERKGFGSDTHAKCYLYENGAQLEMQWKVEIR